jgi:AbrB family looped-hinge helix DNA binding protein
MAEAKLSSKCQIVIPRDVRRQLGLKPGDKVVLAVRGDTAILIRKPKKSSEALARIAEGVYPPDYLELERQSWR